MAVSQGHGAHGLPPPSPGLTPQPPQERPLGSRERHCSHESHRPQQTDLFLSLSPKPCRRTTVSRPACSVGHHEPLEVFDADWVTRPSPAPAVGSDIQALGSPPWILRGAWTSLAPTVEWISLSRVQARAARGHHAAPGLVGYNDSPKSRAQSPQENARQPGRSDPRFSRSLRTWERGKHTQRRTPTWISSGTLRNRLGRRFGSIPTLLTDKRRKTKIYQKSQGTFPKRRVQRHSYATLFNATQLDILYVFILWC